MKKMTALVLLLALTIAAHAQTATVSVYAPPMPVVKHRLGLWQAQREDCIVTVVYSDTDKRHTALARVGVSAGDAIIPATWVRGIVRKSVDSCVASGVLDNGDTIVVCLPREPVAFSRLERCGLRVRVVMVACEIDCPTTLVRKRTELNKEQTYVGIVHFNSCEAHAIGRGVRLADATTTPEAILTIQK